MRYKREDQLFNELWDAIEEEEEDLEKVSELIKRGCDVNGRDGAAFDDGVTFLMVAAASGNLEIVKLLIESGADVNAWSRDSDLIQL
ncbi:MAG: ankyrin repeat domain-containing protein [Cyanobacteria bacterium P01_A01_bin.83]